MEFGAGTGRGAGFYRQYAKVADPVTASEEAAAAERARRRAERARATRAAEENAAKEEAREERAERAREAARGEARAKAEAEARGGADGGGASGGAGGGGAGGGGAGGGSALRREALLDLDLQRRASFAEYELAFQAFLARTQREGRLVPRAVPLPPRGQPIEPAASLAEWQLHVKRALLRWHPDKWAARMQMLDDEAEAAQLKQLTEGMFRAVSRAKDRGFLPQRWAAA